MHICLHIPLSAASDCVCAAHFSPALFPLSSCAVSDDTDTATKWSKAGSRDSTHRNELKIILPNEALLTGQHLIILFPHGEQKGMADVFGDHRHVPKGTKMKAEECLFGLCKAKASLSVRWHFDLQ